MKILIRLQHGPNAARMRVLHELIPPIIGKEVNYVKRGKWSYSVYEYTPEEGSKVLTYYHSTHPGPGELTLWEVGRFDKITYIDLTSTKGLKQLGYCSTDDIAPPNWLKGEVLEAAKKLPSERLQEALKRWEENKDVWTGGE
jgi:hypothetical protein